MMMGGAFFPFEALPNWMASIGIWAPNGFLLERLKDFLIYEEGIGSLAAALPYALTMAAVLWVLCAWRARPFAGRSE